jgi:predicted transcriptional regulator of viral defense system
MFIIINKKIRFGGIGMTEARIQKMESLFKPGESLIRSEVLRAAKFCGKDVAELIQRGKLLKVRRGYYALGRQADFLNDFEQLAAIIPEGIVSLFSAAQFHDLSTLIPQAIEITLPSDMRTPVLPENLHVKVYKSKIPIYAVGIETTNIENVTLKIYDRERTVCDFFRMRLKTGKDTAMEVLRNYMAGKKNLQKIYEYARALRIENIIHPYLEAMV